MSITSDSAKALVTIGCNLEITEKMNYTSDTVKAIITIAKAHNAHVTVHASGFTSDSLKAMATIGKGSVTIVL